MNRVEYGKARAGMRVVNVVELRNRLIVVPRGRLFEVERKRDGFHLVAVDGCECCGVQPRFGHVPPQDVRPA